ncbi:uncharacterized protein LOC127143842 [Cucumis melo]|uniref:Uncharacterized protein LOC127143842 n=1 Tax=Cucumis melo TaxID=3656 RepID=A0ABM3KB84_CUCME|nr:uncharacterized protein LOC127143842 [Cucumis melo]
MSTSYSMWLVVLLPYNLLPWKCMKETNFFMSLLIPSPKSSGREIDVYLQPLIEELKELWLIGTFSTTTIPAVNSRSNHGRTRLLDRSSFTIIVAGPSRFYNDSTSSLREKGSRSIMWSCSRKHMFEQGLSCRRPPRMRIIKCWNSNPSLPQRVVSHSLRMRYAIRCWVDDQATQKALVGDQSRRPAGRRVQAVRRHLVCSS